MIRRFLFTSSLQGSDGGACKLLGCFLGDLIEALEVIKVLGFVWNKMHKAFPLLGESSHWQYKFSLPVEGVPTSRRMEIPLPRVCTAMMKKLPVKENFMRINMPARGCPTTALIATDDASVVVAAQSLTGDSLYMYREDNPKGGENRQHFKPEVKWEQHNVHDKENIITLFKTLNPKP
nr:transducin beta-like protein 2 [Tanacetum cinerariifolium]